MIRRALAIDLGGTEVRAALVEETGAILDFASVPTDAEGGPDAVIDQIAALVRTVRPARGNVEILGLGIGAPGPLDPQAGRVIAAPTLRGWHDVPLAARLAGRLDMPVRLDNDANVAALGEWRFGAGRGTRHMVFVTVSTGIGGGVIVDGRLLYGRRGLAAEIGHMTIADGKERCFCGALGCWEALASGSALGWQATRRAASGPEGDVLRRMAAGGPITARHVGDAARGGDALALDLLAEEARWLGVGLVNLLHLYSPERLIVGGGLSACLDLMRPTIEQTVADRAMPAYRDVPVLTAALGDRAGLVGAASLLF